MIYTDQGEVSEAHQQATNLDGYKIIQKTKRQSINMRNTSLVLNTCTFQNRAFVDEKCFPHIFADAID